jgi:hypothetical protein
MATPLGFGRERGFDHDRFTLDRSWSLSLLCCMTFSKNAATFLQIMLEMVSRNFGPVLFARGIVASTCDDSTPFLADGTVTANLPRFLENTAKIETAA